MKFTEKRPFLPAAELNFHHKKVTDVIKKHNLLIKRNLCLILNT